MGAAHFVFYFGNEMEITNQNVFLSLNQKIFLPFKEIAKVAQTNCNRGATSYTSTQDVPPTCRVKTYVGSGLSQMTKFVLGQDPRNKCNPITFANSQKGGKKGKKKKRILLYMVWFISIILPFFFRNKLRFAVLSIEKLSHK